jgi:STAS domain-containing protein
LPRSEINATLNMRSISYGGLPNPRSGQMAEPDPGSKSFPNDRSRKSGDDPHGREPLPAGVIAFEASELLLLDAVIHYFDSARWTDHPARVLILDLHRLATLDGWGARTVALLGRLCRGRGTTLVLSRLAPAARATLGRTGVIDEIGPRNAFTRWEDALARAGEIVAGRGDIR